MKNGKDTIYIDVDDEITSIIDKVQHAQEGLVALVLPKRAAMLQSSINMKLLKRAAEKSKKNLVLITAEAGLMPLASAIGLFVSKDLQSKPAIPKAAIPTTAVDELIKADNREAAKADFDPKTAAGIAIGELAADDLVAGDKLPVKPQLSPLAYKRATDEEEPVLLDNSEKPEDNAVAPGKKTKDAKDKKLKVPNFERFRTWLIIIVALIILLIVGFIIANKVLPKAVVTISTKTSSVNSNLALTLSPTATALNTSQLIVPANDQQSQQTASKQVATTGQKNEGTPATGSVVMTITTDCATVTNNNIKINAGVGITSSTGQVFITQNPANNWSHGSNCTFSSNKVSVTAQAPGQLGNNLPSSGSSFTVPLSSVTYTQGSVTNVSAAANNNFTDGTNKIVQVVSQADITSATGAITMPPSATINSTLTNALKAAGYDPIGATYNAGTPNITQTANVGDPATTVTVTEAITYSMFGAKDIYLNTLITDSVNQQIDTSKQAIQNTGLSQAAFSGVAQTPTQATLTMQTTSTIGPHLNIAKLKAQIAGLKKGDLETTLEQNPGVTGVTVKYSPFWVSATPKNVNKITINLKKAT